MNIVFLFGGALTAKQVAVIDAEISAGNQVKTINQIEPDLEYDLLVYGSGFRGLDDLADAVPFSEYVPSAEPELEDEAERELEQIDDCCDINLED